MKKTTYQPSRIIRKRRHGFRARMATKAGKQIINREEFSVEIIKEQEKIALENDNAEKENIAIGKAKAEEERIAIKKAKAKEGKTLISDENSNLKRLLSESFPDKQISLTDNKDGSQTILII